MDDEFEQFAQQIGKGSADNIVERKAYQCPHCKDFLSDSYIDSNPYLEIPCTSCGSLIPMEEIRNIKRTSRDQRTEKRCPAALRVSYKTFDLFIDEYTKNVSRQGMFIRTKRPHRVNEIAELLLHVPELSEPVKIKGEIVHVENNALCEEDCGVGVKFIDIDDRSREALISFIKSRENYR